MLGDVMPRCAPACAAPGSAALDLAYVAAGFTDGFFEMGLSPWDVAAGALLVTEAGGLIGNFTGEADFLEQKECLAANPRIYGQLVGVVGKYSKFASAGDKAAVRQSAVSKPSDAEPAPAERPTTRHRAPRKRLSEPREQQPGKPADQAGAGSTRIWCPHPVRTQAQMRPPWRSMMRATMASPTPVPGTSLPRCSRWNRPNSLSARPCQNPRRLSGSKRPDWHRTQLHRGRSPGRAYLIALSSRLDSTWRSKVASPMAPGASCRRPGLAGPCPAPAHRLPDAPPAQVHGHRAQLNPHHAQQLQHVGDHLPHVA
jgi:hypothetical protein